MCSCSALGWCGDSQPVRKRKKILLASAAILLATFVSLLIGEVIVRFAYPQNLTGSWFVPSNLNYWINKPGGTARHQVEDRAVRYRFNEHHLRGGELENASHRVLCLGDSYTFGWLMEEKDCFVNQLAAKAKQELAPASIEFLNGGTSSWGASSYTAFFEDYCEPLKPQTVIAFLSFADLYRSRIRGPYRWAEGKIELVQAPPGKHTLRYLTQQFPPYQWLLEHSHLLQLARFAWQEAGKKKLQQKNKAIEQSLVEATSQAAVDEEAVRYGQAIFRRLHECCQKRGARLIVVAIGAGSALNQLMPGPRFWTDHDQLFAKAAPEFFASLDVPFIDMSDKMTQAMSSDPARFFIKDDMHFSEAGNALFTDTAWPHLKAELSKPIRSETQTAAK